MHEKAKPSLVLFSSVPTYVIPISICFESSNSSVVEPEGKIPFDFVTAVVMNERGRVLAVQTSQQPRGRRRCEVWMWCGVRFESPFDA